MLAVRVLGELTIEADGERLAPLAPARARALLGWLALHPGLHSRGAVAARFWPDVQDSSARTSLRNALWTLRGALGPAADAHLIATREQVGLVDVSVDADEFGRHVSADRLAEALELCRGELLAGLEDDWVLEARDRHAAQQAAVMRELATAAQAAGDDGGALALDRRRVELDPLSEEAVRDLMQRLAATGDRAGALAAFERLAQRLRKELSVAPAQATREAAERIRGGGAKPMAAAVAVGPGEFPHRLALARRGPFVGREQELRELRELWAETCSAAEIGVLLIGGEPGAGKTRLAAELAAHAHDTGAHVLHGTESEEPLTPYQPFVEALRAHVDPAVGPAALAPLLPELADAAGKQERYTLFEAVVELLCGLASTAPVLFVLDDLHWADPPTAQLLRHIALAPRPAPLLFVVTYRETELAPSGPLAQAVADASRQRPVERILLGGLAASDVERWIATAGADPDLATRLHADTEGNPLFISELLRHLGEAGPDAGIPDTIRDLIAGRVARLGDAARHVLTLAAVAGHEFDAGVVGAAADGGTEQALEELDRAAEAGIVVDVPGHADRLAFTHTLIRQTLYSAPGAPRRTALHQRIGEATERCHAHDLDSHLTELAHHFGEGAALNPPDAAVDYALRAGERAARQLAYEDALAFYDRALALLPDVHDPRRRLLALKRAVSQQAVAHLVMDRVQLRAD